MEGYTSLLVGLRNTLLHDSHKLTLFNCIINKNFSNSKAFSQSAAEYFHVNLWVPVRFLAAELLMVSWTPR